MKERILEELIPQVRQNCLISDARFWGYYTICGLLLRLREQYRFERGLGPGEPVDAEDIGRWIGEREAGWESLSEAEFSSIRIEGQEYDPFDLEGINSALAPYALLYGAGYGVYMKPVFFLADLDATERLGELDVFYAGHEYTRDLSVHPAMLREHMVVARYDSSLVLIEEKFEEYRASRGHGALRAAFEAYGLGPDSDAQALEAVAREELRTFVYHEVGEHLVTAESHGLWTEVLACSPQRRSCHFVRGLKDVLADTVPGGMLSYIIEHERAGSLAFHASMLSGHRKLLSHKLDEAFQEFLRAGDWHAVERAQAATYRYASEIADRLLDTYRRTENPEELERQVEAELVQLSRKENG